MSGAQVAGRRLAWHSLLNAAGQGLPVLVALAAVPLLVRGLGAERFGLLTLAWAVVGYFSFLDLGLGRALTQQVAARRAGGDDAGVDALVRRSLRLMLGIGVVGGALAALAAAPLAERWLDVSPALRGEAVRAFLVVAATVPVVVLTTGLRGVLEALHRFDLVNVVRAPLGALTYAAPVVLLAWTRDLAAVMLVLLATRVAGLAVYALFVSRLMPGAARGAAAPAEGPGLGGLLAAGGWITVSGVLSPVLTTVDRFVVGALATAASVAFYTVPYEMATKLLIVPGAIFSSVFPAFAGAAADGAPGASTEAQARLFGRASALVLASVLPAALALALFAPEVLRLWAGPEYAARGATVLRVLTAGVLCNALAHVPIALVQASGRADLAARLHLLELVPFLLVLWALVAARGVEGAAIAWALRAMVDAVALFALARRVSPALRGPGLAWLWAGCALAPLAVAATPLAAGMPALWRAALVGAATLLALGPAWRTVGGVGRVRA